MHCRDSLREAQTLFAWMPRGWRLKLVHVQPLPFLSRTRLISPQGGSPQKMPASGQTRLKIPPLQRIVHFAHTRGTQIRVQLGHAGRKGSTLAPCLPRVKAPRLPRLPPWVIGDIARTRSAGGHVALENERAWPDNGTNDFVLGPESVFE
ncbi:hypothetical protein JB92DRAFT_2926399 [Gautieria morchelliformis]|nr:hypothetical protein JB92DRAFT_2926399 [Gautieria morchelliformis]